MVDAREERITDMSHYFLAIRAEQDAISSIQAQLLPYYAYRRVYRTDEFHLTLQFFGELDDEEVETVIETIEPITASTAPFTLALTQLDHFGNALRPRVLVMTPEPSVDLNHMAKQLRRALTETLPRLDRKPFVPHVTLAKKWHEGERRPYVPPSFHIEVPVDELVLYQIQPQRVPAYEAIHVFPLTRPKEDLWRSRLKFLT